MIVPVSKNLRVVMRSKDTHMRTKRAGFTLIELLVVIAIIAILAAITFPVMARAKDGAYKSGDLSNMNSIRTALQLYREDQGGFPPALLGYATLYESGPNMGAVVPADKAAGYLYPKRIQSVATLKPAYNRDPMDGFIVAVWPEPDPRPVGSAPLFDLNGDGTIDANDDPLGARQAYGPGSGFVSERGLGVTSDPDLAAKYYAVSGYDVGEQRIGNTVRRTLRYNLFWTNWGLASGNGMDDPRQLGYSDPPDDTVITWNSMFRDPGSLQGKKQDLVLFLGGSARTYDSLSLAERSWRVLP